MRNLILAAALLPSSALAQETACLPVSEFDTFMSDNNMVMIGSPVIVTSIGEVDGRLYVSNIDGEWILIVLPPNETACAVLWGWGFWDGGAM